MSEPITAIDEAKGLIYGDREADYGHPRDNWGRTAKMWSAFLGIDVSPRQCLNMMILAKVAREAHRPKRDNIVDVIGYAALIERCEEVPEGLDAEESEWMNAPMGPKS